MTQGPSGIRRYDRAPAARAASLKAERQAATIKGIITAIAIGVAVLVAPCILTGMVLPVYRYHPMTARMILVGAWWVVVVAMVISALWPALVAFAEDTLCGLMYILLPGYAIYYVITRWSEIWRSLVAYGLTLWLFVGTSVVCASYGAHPWAIFWGENPTPRTAADDAAEQRRKAPKRPSAAAPNAPANAAKESAELEEARKPGGRLSPIVVPPTSVFEPMPAGASAWAIAGGALDKLGPEVSIGKLRLRPPAALLIKPPREGLPANQVMADWDGRAVREDSFSGFDKARLTLRTMPKSPEQAQQHRPWLVERGKEVPEEHQVLLAHTVAPGTTERYAHSNGLTWLIFESKESFPEQVTFAYTTVGDQWLSVRFSVSHRADASDALSAAVASIRLAKDDETFSDPYALETLMRMGRANDVWAQDRLKRERADIELALLADLRSTKQDKRLRAIQLLTEIGTDNCHNSLKAAVLDPDSAVSLAALRAMQKLAPEKLDPFDVAVAMLRSSDVQSLREGLASLRKVKPDDRRDKVLPALWALVEKDHKGHREYWEMNALRPQALDLAASWAGKDAVPRLIALIGATGERRFIHDDLQKRAIVLLGKTGDERALPVLVSLLDANAALVAPALIAYGPAAEKELLRLLRSEDHFGKAAIIQVLGEVGGRASLPVLAILADSRDVFNRHQAEAALAHRAILERLKEQRTAATQPQ